MFSFNWFWRGLIFSRDGIATWVTSLFLNSRSPGEQVKCETCSGNHHSAVSGIFCHPGEYVGAEELAFAKGVACHGVCYMWDSWNVQKVAALLSGQSFGGRLDACGGVWSSSGHVLDPITLLPPWQEYLNQAQEMRWKFRWIALFSESWNRRECFSHLSHRSWV